MKVVLDTNVLVSGILFTGPPHQILLAWSEGRFELVFTSNIHEDTAVSLQSSSSTSPGSIYGGARPGAGERAAFPPTVLERQVCTDPDDDKFLACAVASGACTIVSGDKHLLSVSGYRGIEVLRPRAFLERYLPR